MKLKKMYLLVLVVVLLINISGVIIVNAKDLTIKDVQKTGEEFNSVQWVVNQRYMSLTQGKFFPAKLVTRSEFAAIVTKLTGSTLQYPKKPSFQDVTVKNQFYKQIETAKNYMVTYKNKTGKLFKPNSNLTREDAMMAIVKILGYDSDEAVSSNDNTDVSLDDIIDDARNVNPVLVKYISIGISNDLMDLRVSEDKSFFDPKKNITRIDLALLIYNAYQKKDYSSEEYDENNQNGSTDQTQSDTNVPSQGIQPVLSELGIATWNNIAGAVSYQVQLYRNGLAQGPAKSVSSGIIGYDFLEEMRASGASSYTFTVKAQGSDKTTDSTESNPSNAQIVTKAETVTSLNLSSAGIATWTPTNGTSYDLKLYKDGILLNTQIAATSGYNYFTLMRNSGVGKYTITVTVKSDKGLLNNGDESGISAAQEVTILLQAAQPTWVFTKTNWLPVANAINYEIKLYKDGSLIDTETTTAGTTSYDFETIIAKDPLKTYRFTVKAKGDGLYLDGPISEPSAITFYLKDFMISDGISITSDSTANTHTISFYKDKLPVRLPGQINICLVSTDDVSDYGVLGMVSFHKDHKVVTFTFNGRSGEYYRWKDDNRKYSLILLFDTDMNFLGYYTYQNS